MHDILVVCIGTSVALVGHSVLGLRGSVRFMVLGWVLLSGAAGFAGAMLAFGLV